MIFTRYMMKRDEMHTYSHSNNYHINKKNKKNMTRITNSSTKSTHRKIYIYQQNQNADNKLLDSMKGNCMWIQKNTFRIVWKISNKTIKYNNKNTHYLIRNLEYFINNIKHLRLLIYLLMKFIHLIKYYAIS